MFSFVDMAHILSTLSAHWVRVGGYALYGQCALLAASFALRSTCFFQTAYGAASVHDGWRVRLICALTPRAAASRSTRLTMPPDVLKLSFSFEFAVADATLFHLVPGVELFQHVVQSVPPSAQ